MAGVYDAILGRAYGEIFGLDGTRDPDFVVKSGWAGAGAGIAAWWLESDREITAQQACDLLYQGMRDLILESYGSGHVPQDARALFVLGFNWLLQYEVASPGTVVH
jgi:hypothetical protein